MKITIYIAMYKYEVECGALVNLTVRIKDTIYSVSHD